jgi:hypothetical protein
MSEAMRKPVQSPPGDANMRFFNTEGPVRPDMHYVLPPLGRWDLDDVLLRFSSPWPGRAFTSFDQKPACDSRFRALVLLLTDTP